MNDISNILSFIDKENPESILKEIAHRVKSQRLALNLTQQSLAKRSDVTLPSYRRFETTGEISLRSLVKIAIVLDAVDDFQKLFSQKQFSNLDEVIAANKSKSKKRGRKNE